MATEYEMTLEGLQTSIQMEIDGKEYYLKASQTSGNELGKTLLETLSREEDSHRRRFETIFTAISAKKDWPATDLQPDGGKGLRTIFARATEKLGSDVEAVATELDTVKTAMDMENKTYDFYKRRGGTAIHEAEKEFYETLAGIEQEHHLILLDYYEYLKDPAAWFVKSEHPSLDGG